MQSCIAIQSDVRDAVRVPSVVKSNAPENEATAPNAKRDFFHAMSARRKRRQNGSSRSLTVHSIHSQTNPARACTHGHARTIRMGISLKQVCALSFIHQLIECTLHGHIKYCHEWQCTKACKMICSEVPTFWSAS